MAQRFQNAVVKAGFLFTLLNLAAFSGGSLLVWFRSFTLRGFRFQETLPWWLRLEPRPDLARLIISCLAAILVQLVFALLARISLGGLFRRTRSPEVFFLIVFAVSLCLENLRLGIMLSQAWSLPTDLSLLLSRGVYLGRTLAMMCLLAASVYAAGLRYTHVSVLVGLLFLLSLTLSAIIPLNTVLLELNFLYPLGDRQGYLFMNFGLAFIIILNFIIARLTRREHRFLHLALAAALLLLGKELLAFAVTPLLVAVGALVLALGFLLFVRNVGIYYLGL